MSAMSLVVSTTRRKPMAGTRPLIALWITLGSPSARSGPPVGGKPWQPRQMLP